MIYLLISILLNAYIGIIFTYFHRYKIDAFQAIVFNYWTCVITGSFFLGHFPLNSATLSTPWFGWAVLMGSLFIAVFNLIATSSVRVGVTITQTANKLSLAIPVLFSFIFYQERISWLKLTGIALAMIAVVLTSSKKSSQQNIKVPAWQFALPILLFIGSGIIDTLTKFVQRNFLVDEMASNAYLIVGFFMAAFWGSIVLSINYIRGKKQFEGKHVLAGIVLGIPNYFSIYYLIKALQDKSMNSSATIPINNIGVLFVVSCFGIFVFHEKLSRKNYLGLLLSLLAILFIYLGD
ncbi:MAG: EamA family transporter [Chitinophagaceae bacterium]|nr:EamA family transporter [Chitinophagaceae bacterium]